jgi:chemotaxis protein CheD
VSSRSDLRIGEHRHPLERATRPVGAGRELQRRAFYLHPGQLLVAREPTAVTTILGSCVSVCLFDPRRAVGGANHFMLPNWAGHGRASARFGNVAIQSLVEGLLAAGCARSSLKARLFGGSHLLPGPVAGRESSSMSGLGARNVEIARDLLRADRIEILSEDVGGRRGRKLTFFTEDGSFQLKTLQGSPGAPDETRADET